MDSKQAAEIFFALSNKDRLRIAKVISRKPITAKKISESLNICIANVYRYLADFENNGLATKDKESGRYLYSLSDKAKRLIRVAVADK